MAISVLRRSATNIWVVLMLATCVSWWLAHGGGPVPGHVAASMVIVVVAFAKIRLIGLYFMELRDAPVALRALFEAYVAVVGGGVIGMYFLA